MSDVQPTAEEKDRPGPAKNTSPLRLVVLLLVFGVALAGLLYDYCIARPSINKADKLIENLLQNPDADPNGDGTVTEDEVQSVLGCKPAQINNIPNGKVEVYTWRSGLPYRTYKLYVVYQGQQMPLLYSASTNAEPTGNKLPPTTRVAKPMTTEERENFVPPKVSGAGAGGGSGRRGGGKASGGKGGGRGRGKKQGKAADGQNRPPADAGKSGQAAQPDDAAPAKKDEAKSEEKAQPAQEEPKPDASSQPPAKEEPAAEPAGKPEAKPEPPAKEEPPAEPAGKQEAKPEPPAKEEPKPEPPKTDAPPSEPPPADPSGDGQ